MRTLCGIFALLFGIVLTAVPFSILRVPANAPGDGGPNFVPLIQTLCALAGAVVAIIVAWFLLKRRS